MAEQAELAHWMRSNGVKQKAIAELLGLSHSRVVAIMAGKRRLSEDEAQIINGFTRGQVAIDRMLENCEHIRWTSAHRRIW